VLERETINQEVVSSVFLGGEPKATGAGGARVAFGSPLSQCPKIISAIDFSVVK
jgi:hypothetical protein